MSQSFLLTASLALCPVAPAPPPAALTPSPAELAPCPQGTSPKTPPPPTAARRPAYEFVEAFPAQKRFDKPLFLDRHPTDPEHDYVVEQDGKIFRIRRDPERAERHVFLDWEAKSDRRNWEEGLLGFAFDPEYRANHQFYIYYSFRPPGTGERYSVISRLVSRQGEHGPVADPASELVLMKFAQPYGNHNGGTILFGPDRMMYVAVGDGGKADDPHDNGQNRRTLLGSVLRVDVRGATADKPYAIPPDNPFVAEMKDGVRGEIWAYGLRNPWRISFDRKTGDLWCGDVGQGRWEEVDRIVRGGNYGWNHREGNETFKKRTAKAAAPPDLIPPIAEYDHSQGLSVTGGHVYRGANIPDLQGCYVYGDFMTCRVWAVREDRKSGNHTVTYLCRAESQIASFAEDHDGEILALCYNGRIYRLQRLAK